MLQAKSSAAKSSSAPDENAKTGHQDANKTALAPKDSAKSGTQFQQNSSQSGGRSINPKPGSEAVQDASSNQQEPPITVKEPSPSITKQAGLDINAEKVCCPAYSEPVTYSLPAATSMPSWTYDCIHCLFGGMI